MTPAGVAYEVFVPSSLVARLPMAGEEVELHTALLVRDDALELYGFQTGRDRELFLRLQSASGVGPRLALAILGTLSTPRVIRAIRGKEHAALRMVSGVGKKTAERIVLELADKVEDLAAGIREADGAAPSVAAVEALRALGYAPAESDEAVDRARVELGGREATAEELIRVALRHM